MAYQIPWQTLLGKDPNELNPVQAVGGGESSVISPENASVDQSGRKQGSSGQYTNLQNYLSANSDQGQKLTNNMASNITNEYNTANKSITDNTVSFNKKVNDGTISGLDTAKDEAGAITTAARTNSANNKITDEQKNRFGVIGNAQYKGPNDWTAEDYYQPMQSQVTKSKDYYDLAGTDAGRYTLLDKMFNKGNYSRGEQKFDNLLLSSDANNAQNLNAARESTKDINQKFEDATKATTDFATGIKTKTDEARNFAKDNLASNKQARTAEVENEINAIKNKWGDEYDAYNAILSAYKGGNLTLTQDQINKLGLNDNSRLYNVLKDTPASNYLDLATFDANKVVSKDAQSQLSDLDLLDVLTGGTASNKYQNAAQAGTLNLDNNFKADRFGQAANQANDYFNNLATNTNVGATKADREDYNIKTGEIAGNPIYVGQQSVEQQYTTNQNLQNFLNNNKQLDASSLNEAISNIYNLGYSREEKDARAAAISNAKAESDAAVYAELMRILSEQGYDNKVQKFSNKK